MFHLNLKRLTVKSRLKKQLAHIVNRRSTNRHEFYGCIIINNLIINKFNVDAIVKWAYWQTPRCNHASNGGTWRHCSGHVTEKSGLTNKNSRPQLAEGNFTLRMKSNYQDKSSSFVLIKIERGKKNQQTYNSELNATKNIDRKCISLDSLLDHVRSRTFSNVS